MNIPKNLLAVGIFVSVLSLLAIQLFGSNKPSFGGAPPGVKADEATSSQPTVGTSVSNIVATSSCQARIITTYASPIMLTFTELRGDIPSATNGVLQAASTTVVYDASQYGCDAVQAWGFVSTKIYVVETR